MTITADGKEIGTVQANENGEWTFTTDEKISNPDAKLALFKAPPGPRVLPRLRPGRPAETASRRASETAVGRKPSRQT